MIEIDVEKEKAKYQLELEQYSLELQRLDSQRVIVLQAINERRGILIFLNSLDQHKEDKLA